VDKEEMAFYRGWAVLASFIARDHDMPNLVQDAAGGHGVTLTKLRQAKVDKYDLDILSSLFRRVPDWLG